MQNILEQQQQVDTIRLATLIIANCNDVTARDIGRYVALTGNKRDGYVCHACHDDLGICYENAMHNLYSQGETMRSLVFLRRIVL